MKLPLKWGLAALVGLWLLHSQLDDANARTTVLIAAMGVALWTAFSLNIPPKREPPEQPLLEPPEEAEADDSDGAAETKCTQRRDGANGPERQ